MKVAKFTYRDYNYRPLDERPFPDFDSFGVKRMVDEFSQATRVLYRYSRPNPRPFIIVTARGCPFHCSFCIKHPAKYRARSIDNIMQEIKANYEKYKFNILIIQDELFAVNKQRMVEFCKELIERKKEFGWDFDWMMQTHANARLDLETLKLAKEAGCFLFSYGLESVSPVVIKSMNKKTHQEQIVEAIEMADKVGIGFAGNILFGDPAETEETIQETMRFYFRYGIESATIFLSLVTPYPGSDIFDYCLKKGIIKDKLHYYETIDEHVYNMTSIPNHLFLEWVKFLHNLEHSYMMFRVTTAHECAHEGNSIWRISANCPFCGKESVFTQVLPEDPSGKFLVPLCQHCNKRIRVNIPIEERRC